MKCIKCGREISDGELFCDICSMLPRPTSSAPAMQAKSVKRAADKQAAKQPSARPHTTHPVKKSAHEPEVRLHKKPIKLVISLILACMAVLALMAFIFNNWSDLTVQRANLRVREADVALREADMEKMEKELAAVNEKLVDANASYREMETQNEDLARQLSGTQSTVSQTQFDMTSQQQALEKMTLENESLNGMLDELEAQNETLQSKIATLTTSNATYSEKAGFMDSYVVFVNNDGTKSFHKYDCKDFNRKSFWAYSRKLAQSNGYAACPVCGG